MPEHPSQTVPNRRGARPAASGSGNLEAFGPGGDGQLKDIECQLAVSPCQAGR